MIADASAFDRLIAEIDQKRAESGLPPLLPTANKTGAGTPRRISHKSSILKRF